MSEWVSGWVGGWVSEALFTLLGVVILSRSPLTVSSQAAYLLGSLIYLEVLVASLVGVSSETEVAHFALWTFSIEHDCASELECPFVACWGLELLPARWRQQKQNSPFLAKSNQKPVPESCTTPQKTLTFVADVNICNPNLTDTRL